MSFAALIQGGIIIVKHLQSRLWAALIALVALGLSASLTFGAHPPQAEWGLATAGSHVPLAGQNVDEAEEGDEDATEAEDTEEEESSEEAGENCSTDPTALTPEELDALRHGSVVCWAAHQTEWPEWFDSHGAFVRCWAHQGKADSPSCTEAPAEDAGETDTDTTDVSTRGHGNGKVKDQSRGQAKGKHKAE